eukprot:1160366-Pelagomonas_calceolata.AAC.2
MDFQCDLCFFLVSYSEGKFSRKLGREGSITQQLRCREGIVVACMGTLCNEGSWDLLEPSSSMNCEQRSAG